MGSNTPPRTPGNSTTSTPQDSGFAPERLGTTGDAGFGHTGYGAGPRNGKSADIPAVTTGDGPKGGWGSRQNPEQSDPPEQAGKDTKPSTQKSTPPK